MAFGDVRGYWMVQLGTFRRNVRVNRLVAEVFLPNPANRATVNHIDGNKKNNCVENLEWATYQENTAHAIKTGLFYRKLTSEQVQEIWRLRADGVSHRNLAKMFNVSRACIRHLLAGNSYVDVSQTA